MVTNETSPTPVKYLGGSAATMCLAPGFHQRPRPLTPKRHARRASSPWRRFCASRVRGRFHCAPECRR